MNLFNRKILDQRIQQFSFPTAEHKEIIDKVISGWQTSLQQGDLGKTKETSIQGQFLDKFFNTILGYSSSTEGLSQWHYIQHPKSEVDAQEADGSLGFFTQDEKNTKAVIELKDANTPLDKKQSGRDKGYTPIEQAYLYATKFDRCDWIIVSNFREIRLYNKSRTQDFYESFDLLELGSPDEFKRFYFLLHKDNLLAETGKSTVDELFAKTEQAQDEITIQFYSQFKEARLHLLNHLIEHNPDTDNEQLLEHSQKLLDRTVFVMFCEDTNYLLPHRILKNTVDRALNSFSESDERVWTELQGLFRAVDVGNDRVTPTINAYNGGLFKNDPELNTLTIKDDAWEPLIKLSEYDFETDINVNILGHIFEQSISDLESIKQQLREDGSVTKSSKRKKEGIYYTPQYITRYLVENTLGNYLEEHPEKLQDVTVLDPACGSGAFLNQAHSYLFEKYNVEHEERIKDKRVLSLLEDINPAAINRSILLNSLFGVDLNQESVEITKLSLWLKTARSTEPLQNLDKNIKNGDSLISDPEVVGDKAFDWQDEYESILKDGGFDVVVGNPPYIFARGNNFTAEQKQYFYNNYELTNYQLNTYVIFIEKALQLLQDGGWFGYIVPNTWLTIESFSGVRKKLFEIAGNIKIVNIYDKVFTDANVDSCLLIFKKGGNDSVELAEFQDGFFKYVGTYKKSFFEKKNYIINISLAKQKGLTEILDKIRDRSSVLSEYATVSTGLKVYQAGKGKPPQSEEMKKQRVFHSKTKKDGTYVKYLEGQDVDRYKLSWSGEYLSYGDWVAEPRYSIKFDEPRILIRQIPSHPPYCIKGTYTEQLLLNDINSMVVYNFKEDVDPKYLLGILNSRITSFWFQHTFDKMQRKTFPQFKVKELQTFPVPNADKKQTDNIAALVDKITALKGQLTKEGAVSLKLLEKEYGIKASKKLERFYELDWENFYDEMVKQKAKLTLSQKEDVMNWFNDKRQELGKLQTNISEINKMLDSAIYELYGLTDDEIALVEKL